MAFSADLYFYISQHYVAEAEKIWEKMKDVRNTKIRMSHDGYLKLYQLRKPTISGYNCILIDEAQDLTPGNYIVFFCIVVLRLFNF